MAYLIEKIKMSLAREGIEPRTNKARQWLRSKIEDLNPTRRKITTDRERQKVKSIIGRMYFFYYDPKLKDSLPYYDRFPLVIPIERYPDGFLGLNLHYIHPKQRIILLDKLSEFTNNSNYDETTKFRLSYDLLRRTSKIFEHTPCLKRYLFIHIESKFIEIKADEWDIAALLPVESFQKKRSSQVWFDSRKKF